MKILIVSDTHGYNANFEKVLKKVGEPDMLIHAGDVSGSEYYYENVISNATIMVMGNNDYGGLQPSVEFELKGHHFFVTHGHRYRVYYGLDTLLSAASARGADIVIYGHTHRPDVTYDQNRKIWAVNPGSLTYPRQDGRRPSFILMNFDGEDNPQFTINYL